MILFLSIPINLNPMRQITNHTYIKCHFVLKDAKVTLIKLTHNVIALE